MWQEGSGDKTLYAQQRPSGTMTLFKLPMEEKRFHYGSQDAMSNAQITCLCKSQIVLTQKYSRKTLFAQFFYVKISLQEY